MSCASMPCSEEWRDGGPGRCRRQVCRAQSAYHRHDANAVRTSLRAHTDWWGKDIKNVPQQIGAALKDERIDRSQGAGPGLRRHPDRLQQRRPNRWTITNQTSGPRRSTGRPATNSEACTRKAKTPTSAVSRRMRQSTLLCRSNPASREAVVGSTQYALSRSTLALARISRRASRAERLRMIFIAVCGWSRR